MARSWWIAIFCGLMAAGAGAFFGWRALSGSTPEQVTGPTAAVTEGELVVTVTESGELEAERRTIVRNELAWPLIIQEVVPEGKLVKKGDEIIVFQCKELSDAIESKEIKVSDDQNEYTQASANLVLKTREMDNVVRKAEQAVKDAEINLKRYKEGEAPNKFREAKSAIQLAQRDLALAQEKLEFKLKVNRDPELNSPYSENEIEAERLSVERLKLTLKKAESSQDMLIKYDHPRELRKLKMAVADAELDLDRRRLERDREVYKAKATEQAKKLTLRVQEEKLKSLREDASKLVVKAEREGLVVYNTGGSRWRPSNVVVELGAKITPRQQLMVIPDMETLRVKTKVYEVMIKHVRKGLKAYVRLDSEPDRILTGKVDKVAVLPDSQHRWLNPDVKVFNVMVKLDKQVEGLKPGMTAEVELELARIQKVLKVPIASVFTEQEQTYCYRASDGKVQRVAVRIGRMNEREVQVISGLQRGDTVLLAPPEGGGPGRTAEPAETPEKPKTPAVGTPAARPARPARARGTRQ